MKFLGLSVLFISSMAFAAQTLTVQGRLLNTDGTLNLAPSVQFKIQVRSSGTEDCLLYEETQVLNMASHQGAFAVVVGDGTRSAANVDGGNSLEKVFSNSTALSLTAAPAACANAATSYTPGASSTRTLSIAYDDGSGWDYVPSFPLSWVPQAMYSQDSQKLGGASATSYLLRSELPTCASGEFLTKTASGTFSCLDAAINIGALESITSANAYLSATTSGTDVFLTLNVGSGTSTVAAGNDIRFTQALQKTSNLLDLSSSATARTNLGLGSISLLNYLDLSTTYASGTLTVSSLPSYTGDVTSTSGSNVLTLSSTGVVPGTYIKTTVDIKGRVTSSSVLSSSDVTTALGYTPATAASAGITTLNGSSSATQIFVANSTGTVFNISSLNGTHSFNIPLAASASVTAGLISNADYMTFNGKITSSAVSIAQVLGYIPAVSGSAGVGTLLAANNLSDLTSATIARTNLGLGTVAVYNVGTSANNILQLNGSSQVPAVDGSLITSLTRNKITSSSANHVLINDSSGLISSEAALNVTRGGTGTSSYVANALIMANGTGSAFTSATCSSGEILRWNAVAGSWACTSILAAVSSTAFVIGGNSLAASATIGTNDNNDFYLKTNDTNRIQITSAGTVGINLPAASSAVYALQVNGIIAPHVDNTLTLGTATNRFSSVYAGSAVINTSDAREKKDIRLSDLGLNLILKLRPVQYRWKKNVDSNRHYGLIAQDTEKVLREILHDENSVMPIVDHDLDSDRYGIKYSELIAPLILSVQQVNHALVTENKKLHADIDTLSKQNKIITKYLCSKDPNSELCK